MRFLESLCSSLSNCPSIPFTDPHVPKSHVFAYCMCHMFNQLHEFINSKIPGSCCSYGHMIPRLCLMSLGMSDGLWKLSHSMEKSFRQCVYCLTTQCATNQSRTHITSPIRIADHSCFEMDVYRQLSCTQLSKSCLYARSLLVSMGMGCKEPQPSTLDQLADESVSLSQESKPSSQIAEDELVGDNESETTVDSYGEILTSVYPVKGSPALLRKAIERLIFQWCCHHQLKRQILSKSLDSEYIHFVNNASSTTIRLGALLSEMLRMGLSVEDLHVFVEQNVVVHDELGASCFAAISRDRMQLSKWDGDILQSVKTSAQLSMMKQSSLYAVLLDPNNIQYWITLCNVLLMEQLLGEDVRVCQSIEDSNRSTQHKQLNYGSFVQSIVDGSICFNPLTNLMCPETVRASDDNLVYLSVYSILQYLMKYHSDAILVYSIQLFSSMPRCLEAIRSNRSLLYGCFGVLGLLILWFLIQSSNSVDKKIEYSNSMKEEIELYLSILNLSRDELSQSVSTASPLFALFQYSQVLNIRSVPDQIKMFQILLNTESLLMSDDASIVSVLTSFFESCQLKLSIQGKVTNYVNPDILFMISHSLFELFCCGTKALEFWTYMFLSTDLSSIHGHWDMPCFPRSLILSFVELSDQRGTCFVCMKAIESKASSSLIDITSAEVPMRGMRVRYSLCPTCELANSLFLSVLGSLVSSQKNQCPMESRVKQMKEVLLPNIPSFQVILCKYIMLFIHTCLSVNTDHYRARFFCHKVYDWTLHTKQISLAVGGNDSSELDLLSSMFKKSHNILSTSKNPYRDSLMLIFHRKRDLFILRFMCVLKYADVLYRNHDLDGIISLLELLNKPSEVLSATMLNSVTSCAILLLSQHIGDVHWIVPMRGIFPRFLYAITRAETQSLLDESCFQSVIQLGTVYVNTIQTIIQSLVNCSTADAIYARIVNWRQELVVPGITIRKMNKTITSLSLMLGELIESGMLNIQF